MHTFLLTLKRAVRSPMTAVSITEGALLISEHRRPTATNYGSGWKKDAVN